MTIEIALLLSLISVGCAVYSTMKNARRADTTELERKAATDAAINVKLDTIAGDVRDIKYDMTSVKREVQGLTERMIVVEQSTKSAHHRLDGLEKGM